MSSFVHQESTYAQSSRPRVKNMPRLRVTHLATGRTLVGSPDELLDWLGGWWPDEDPDETGVFSTITQAVYEWERGVLDGTRNGHLGVRAELV
jgi:hypothetical protein